jgi:hypothetical protein
VNENMCVWDIYMERFVRVTCPRVAYVLPKCRFISVSVNFEQTQYVLFLGKVMPKFYIYDFEACIIYFITLLLVIPCSRS